jgi:hypothetical protein
MGLCELLRTCSDRSHLRFGRFLGIIRPVDFQQHSQKNQRAFSVTCPETNLQIKTAAESFFTRKSSIQFYFMRRSFQNSIDFGKATASPTRSKT